MMIKPTYITWGLAAFGLLIHLLVVYGQMLLILNPSSKKVKDLLVGKGKDWQDQTHFNFAYGAAWADLLIHIPILIVGSIGVLQGELLGYVLWVFAAGVTVYINSILWFVEGEEVRKNFGPVMYYTWYWGFYIYWGALTAIYALWRITGHLL